MSKTSPLGLVCKNCNAQPGKKCTVPTNNSRKPVSWFHSQREFDAERIDREFK